ncbi:MAG: ADP-ribosylation factor-like protein [Candidatus Helarchaeota archaeon]
MLTNIKIIYCGLDNAGKTSIIKFLESKQYGLNELKPTQGIERIEIQLSMDTQITQWDLGGQERFRQEYIQRERDFHDTDLLFFVIDINDERVDEAVDYLNSVLRIIEKVEQNPQIVVLLHKKDLIDDQDKLDKIVENYKQKIDAIKKNFNVRYFITSIYDELSILNSFSIGLAMISSKARELNMELSKLANKVFADAILLLEKNGFIIGEFSKDKESDHVIKMIYSYLALSFIDIIESGDEAIPNRMILDWDDKGYALMEKILLDEKPYYYLKYSTSTEKIVRKFVLRSILTSSESIRNIIKNYF